MKYLCILMLSFPAFSANYIQVKNGQGIYDVELIVFSRLLPQPPAQTIKNADLFAMENTIEMQWREDGQDTYIVEQEPNQEDWNVPINEESVIGKALVWFQSNSPRNMAGIWQKLSTSSEYQPIQHMSWRQPFTRFNNPKFVAINQVDTTARQINTKPFANNSSELQDSSFTDLRQSNTIPNLAAFEDFTLHGKIALSRGRFSHLHVKLNMIRQNMNGENIIYSIDETRQIQLNKINYFDHKEFGLLVQVTAAKLEP